MVLTSNALHDSSLMKRPMALDFADELSKAFNINEDPKVEELEVSLREKYCLIYYFLADFQKPAIEHANKRVGASQPENQGSGGKITEGRRRG
jgi:hypothetical protein